MRDGIREAWQTLWSSPQISRRVIYIFIALLISTWVGFRYAKEAYIQITPVLIWLYAIVTVFAFLYPRQGAALFRLKMNQTWGGMILLLAAAFALRLYNLEHLPPGFHGDESGSMSFALEQIFHPANGGLTVHPLRSGLDSQPVFYSYILYYSAKLFGYTIAGARMTSVIVGALAIAGTFLLVDEMADRKTAWFTAILVTVYHYHIHWSRIGLSNIWVTLLLPLCIGLFLRGWRLRAGSGAMWAGVCLGLTAYLYTGGYVLIFLLGVVILYTAWKTNEKAGYIIYTGRMLTVAIVIALPLMIFALVWPEAFLDRAVTIYGWSPAAITSTLGENVTTWQYFIYQVVHSFGAYNYYSDVTGFYAPQIPFLIGISSVLFLGGIVLSFYQRQYFALFWMALVTLLGGVMTVGTPGSSHFIPVIPAICWLVAMPLRWLQETKYRNWAYLLLAGIILTDLYFYFVIYANNPSYDFRLEFPNPNP